MNIAVVIPAQDKNSYSDKGDLATIGDVTLLEWKISQVKGVFDTSNIYVLSNSNKINEIVKYEGVNLIERSSSDFSDTVYLAGKHVAEKYILWVNVNVPFMSGQNYQSFVNNFLVYKDQFDSALVISEKREYVIYENKPINFEVDTFCSRKDLNPINIITNSAYIVKSSEAIRRKVLFGNKPYLYPVDMLSAIEINNIFDLDIINHLLPKYFSTSEF